MTGAGVLVLAQLALAGVSCSDAELPPPPPVEPTPAPPALLDLGRYECNQDLDCFGGVLEQTIGPLGQLEPLGATCVHPWFVAGSSPVCECRGLFTRTEPAPGETASFEVQQYPGHRPGGCSELTSPGCLYCASEFPGCTVDDPTSCDAVCADMTTRAARAFQRAFVARARLSRCATNTCHVVTEIEGRCYLGRPLRGDPPEVDCSLSDDELMARVELDLRTGTPSSSCPPVAPVDCTSARDCPHGLACNNGVCGACSAVCSYPTGQPEAAVCEGDAACASAELCAQSRCVPRDNLSCRLSAECPEGEQCVLSGTSSEGRGNAETRTFCE